MLDKVTVTRRGQTGEFPLGADMTATLDVIPQPGRPVPFRPFLHRGDWTDDTDGNVWTVVRAHLHEDDDDRGRAYLWYEYEVVNDMRKL
jgi:hypothetical protein